MAHAICSASDCDGIASHRGMCRKHYSAWWYRQPPTSDADRCITKGCARRAHVHGMCCAHWSSVYRKSNFRAKSAHADGESRRRARNRGAFVSDVDRKAVFEADGYRCYICRRLCNPTAAHNDPRQPTIDHVVPIASGGTHEPSNVRTACRQCNCAKSDKGGGEQFAIDLALR